MNGQRSKVIGLIAKASTAVQPSKVTYAIRAFVGRHGIFSLTPIWLISLAGAVMWLKSPDPQRRELSALILAVSAICIYFFHRLSTFGGTQLWGHDERLPLGLLVRTTMATDRHDSRRRPARSFHDRPGRCSCPPVVFCSFGQLSNLESLDAALVVQLARLVRHARLLNRRLPNKALRPMHALFAKKNSIRRLLPRCRFVAIVAEQSILAAGLASPMACQ